MEQEIVLKKENQSFSFLKPLAHILEASIKKDAILKFLKNTGITLVSILLFIGLWHLGAKALYNVEAAYKIEKALSERGNEAAEAERACINSGDSSCQPNTLPSPVQVWESLQSLIADHKVIKADKAAFVEKMADTNTKLLAEGKNPIVYTGRASFIDIILTSIKTVFAGFLLALLIAVPIGIIIGLSPSLRSAFNWFIQVFKPVSPVVWYLLVFMIVKTLYIGDSSDNAFVISFISVGLCAMWATLVNTAMGVSSVDKDYINVAKVLKLGTFQKIFKVILPSSLPLIFTGLRITLSVAWMVLIAIELLAQSQGLGLFVWEEFQNGANDSNSKIIVAMFVIGIIGFLLDRLMLTIQGMVSFNKNEAV
ncbi:ABC transporter permease [Maribacter sp. CXY002]|uniref:ABC transporter permease n=1 Tax=Maribacter luteocoastalis TaxID=3407671 RepID=UPI003B66EF80